MRNLIFFLAFLFAQITSAQINGNGKLITKSFPIENIQSVEIHLYADIEIDANGKAGMVIEAEENIMDLIAKEYDEGRLTLGQIKWIEPSKPIRIKIGAPQLEQVIQSTHETVLVKNLNRTHFAAMALVGNIQLEGKTNSLNAGVEVGQVDARTLSVEQVEVNIWGWGSVELGTPQKIKGVIKEDGKVVYEGANVDVNVRKRGDASIVNRKETPKVKKPEARYINLKVKNNSMKRVNYYVRGPKPDGKHFGYGFPLNPGQTRHKNWTVGTKVYQESKIGTRKLLVEITEEDENEVVKLYD
ncbi:MAG: DUF2807 domain-containing protein [Bacteroidota bacterium]